MRHTVNSFRGRAGLASTGAGQGQWLGSLIGGIFGLIYVEANAGQLPGSWGAVLQIAAGVAFAGLAVRLALGREPRSTARPAAQSGFGVGGSYWLVVAGEAAAILAGAALLNGPAALPSAVVAWVSVVVGVHFVVLAGMWRLSLFRHLGVAIAVCGAAGMAAAAVGAGTAVVACTGGVLPGCLLLTAGYWGAPHTAMSDTARSPDPTNP